MTKTFKPSEINILQRQVVPTDKVNLTLSQTLEEVRRLLESEGQRVVVCLTDQGKYTTNIVKLDMELLEEQYREVENQTKIKSLLSEQLNDPYVETKLEQAFIDSTRKSIKKWRDYF